ncbi:hypothetical protein K3495_g2713 [Podosphaera aphanis]|nr:hypothetical protein K3495_g2713 [Podosphaera aphanis]
MKMLSKTVRRFSLFCLQCCYNQRVNIRPGVNRVSNLNSQNGTRYLSSISEQQLRPLPDVKKPLKAALKLKTTRKIPKKPKNIASPISPAQILNTTPVSESVRELLPLLANQPSHYITVHIHGRPYLVTAGDTVRLPFKMPDVVPGDVLRLNRAANIGSRDYTLKGTPYIDERLFECRATVMGTESEPMRIKEKKKRRNRRVKTVKSKHRFTILRIAELRVKSLQEIETLPTV